MSMSNNLVKAYKNDSGSSGKPSHSHQSYWMSRRTQTPSKHEALIAPHSQTFCDKEGLHHNLKRMCASLNITSDVPSTSARKRNRSPLLATTSADSDMQPQINLKKSRNYPKSRLFCKDDGDDLGKAMAVSTHFSDYGKYEKYSAIVVHQMNSFSAKKQKDPQSENSGPKGGPPLFSQTAPRNFLITKKMRQKTVNGSTQHGGVKIQPLYSSTDSENAEKENIGGRSCDLSAQTNTMDTVTLSNKNDFSGASSSSLVKLQHTIRDETFVTSRGDPSSSKTQSLEADHILSSAEQPYESKFIPLNKECSAQEPSSRWVQRLKPSSSEMGESSSQEKTHCTAVNNHSKNSIFQCSWIQRWCQDHTGEENKNLDGDSSKSLFDELDKKQFPSIAAMAMMGKCMSGFRQCKFTKRGSLVVWNNEDN